MTAAAQAIREVIEPLSTGWRIQFGRWVDDSRNSRYAVIKPAGGSLAEVVRRPQCTLSLIGADGDSYKDTFDVANSIVEEMRSNSGGIVSLQPGEPAFMATADGRPVFEIAISAITV